VGGRVQDVVNVTEGLTGAGQEGRFSPDGLLAELSALLVDSPSGLAFVYQALGMVVERWQLQDAVLVVGSGRSRQVFRAGRRPLEGPWAAGLAANGDRGLHTDPVILRPEVADGIVSLCEIALRLDLLDHDATHDPLTGLLNRRSFDSVLQQALARSRRYGWSFSLVVLDLNGFKALNDRHGHAAGDQVLQRIGSVLRSSMRAGDVAARMGGDEFAVLLNRSGESAGQLLAARVASIINREMAWAQIGFAVGVATAPAESVDADELSRLADARLYQAKAV
jgi:diguanylate cyclase (GGDEF)-like protein